VSGTKLCPFCAEEIKATAIKCKHCGSMLNETASSESVTSQPSAPVSPTQLVSSTSTEPIQEIEAESAHVLNVGL